MKRLLPTPLLSLALLCLWLLLNHSLSWGHLLLAVVLAIAIPLLTMLASRWSSGATASAILPAGHPR